MMWTKSRANMSCFFCTMCSNSFWRSTLIFLTSSCRFLHTNCLFQLAFQLFQCIRSDRNLQKQVWTNCLSDLKTFANSWPGENNRDKKTLEIALCNSISLFFWYHSIFSLAMLKCSNLYKVKSHFQPWSKKFDRI